MRQFVAACALLLAASAGAAIPSAERSALVDIYQATNGASWTNNARWLSSEPECTWYGVYCDETQSNVIHLELGDNNLDGTLPSSLRNFTKLLSLQVYGNSVRGELPAAIAQISTLEVLYAQRNRLTGSIPRAFGALKNLSKLGLDGNELGGQLPDELGDMAALTELGLTFNAFTGSIPASLASLTELTVLDLSVNQLTGVIPSELGQLTKLEKLTFADNQLTGQLPETLGNLEALIELRGGYNQLTGPIPSTLGNLHALEDLTLEVNDLSGSIPASLGDLASIKSLDLRDNALEGPLPAALYRLQTLEHLQLGDNQLTGAISPELAKLQNLISLGLNANEFTGVIPVELSTIASLVSLELQSNDLEGPIPLELTRLTSLRDLDLSGNRLSGVIPVAFGSLPDLEILSLYSNAIEGTIPPQLGDATKLRILYLGDNQLSGPVPDALRNLTNLEQFTANGNRLTGNIPTWIGEWTKLTDLYLGYNRLEGTLPPGLATLENLSVLDLPENDLTGPLIDFSRLGNLFFLILHNNRFTGPIPASIGALTNVTYVYLSSNQLSGPLPPEIGNLANLEFISLGDNDIEGPIPKEIAGLQKVYALGLCCNHFSGPIPEELSQLSSLQFLDLSFNKLAGPIPKSITRLTTLEDGRSDFAFNGLYTNDPAVRTFMNLKHYTGDFEETQTVTPANFRLVDTTDRSATFTWDPIRYEYYGGGYQVIASKTPGGPAAVVATTSTKTEDTITVRNLEPLTDYHFTVATVSHPISGQDNLIVSERSPAVKGRTKARVIAPPDVVISEHPEGMVQIDGVAVVEDQFTLTNFGDLPTNINLEHEDDPFFTVEPKQFALAGGASRTIAIKSKPREPNTYYGYIVIEGEGVPQGLYVSTVLLSVKRPAGSVLAQPVTTTIELAGEPGSDSVGVAQFRNAGTAELTGIVVSDQPWVVPDPQPIRIAPDTIGAVNFRIVRSKRPAGADGALTANLTLVYVDGGSSAKINLHDGHGVSVSKVTVIDTTRPPVTTGSIPGLTAGEIPLFIPGVANLGNARSDVSLVNAFSGSAIDDLKLYFSSGSTTSIASLQPLRASESVNLVNVAANVYGLTNAAGTLQIRSREWASIGTQAKATVVTSAGTYSGAIPVFRGDRSVASGARVYLAGVVPGGDLFVQETGGAESRVAIEFLDATGNPTGSTRTETVSAYGLLELRGIVPANAATAMLTNGGSGAVTGYVRNTDAATGDSWSVVDWGRFYGYSNESPVRIPFADARSSTGGKKRSVRSTAVGPEPAATSRATTDLVIFNPMTDEVRAQLEVVAADGSRSARTITVAPRATITLRDVGAAVSGSAHILVTPTRGSLVLTARSHYGSYGTAIPVLAATQGLRLGQSQVFSSLEDSAGFRTSYGLVETGGEPVSVRARILIGESYALVTATTTRTFELGAGQHVVLPELLRSFAGDQRDGFGDLHDLTIEFEVIGGSGAVVPFLVVTDTATGDPSVKME